MFVDRGAPVRNMLLGLDTAAFAIFLSIHGPHFLSTIRIFFLTLIVAVHITHPATLQRGASGGDPERRSGVVVSPEAVSGRAGEVRETRSSG